MRIEINPAYKKLEQFINDLPALFNTTGETIYEGRNILKRYVIDENLTIVVKRFKIPHLLNQFVYGSIRHSKARRSFIYAKKLLERGISTPTPIAYIEQFNWGLKDSYYISVESPLKRIIREFWDNPTIGDRTFILEAFGRMTAKMHKKGVVHLDYSAGNILFDIVNDKLDFTIVDVNRIKFGRVSEKEGYANLNRLWLNDDAYKIISSAYAKTLNYDSSYAEEKILYYKRKVMK